MKINKLKVGFIGGAVNSAVGYAHFAAVNMDGKYEITAGAFSRDPKINFETANVYGVPNERVYSDWRQMLENESHHLDAVIVLTPTPTHFEIVSECIEAGYPVICEKALATNCEEIKQLQHLRDKHNGFVAVTYNYSGYPLVRELRDIIKSGKMGKVLHVQAEMPQEGYIRVDELGNKPHPQNWRLKDGKIPTIHLDLAVHLHQLIYYLIEKSPLKVVSDQQTCGWFSVVDNVTAMCRYEGDVLGQFWFSKSALGHRNGLRLRIFGENASAEWFQANAEEILISYSDGRREVLDRGSGYKIASKNRYTRFKVGHPAGYIEAFANLYCDIFDCLNYFKKTGNFLANEVFSTEVSFEGAKMLETMAQSSKLKKWLEIV
ncbi:Gfo/Idh/MocA family protein [Sedimentisphaera salicampi]|uniref:Gfo/Idh/MocA family protein n=1 Tax=Sedimentisphaera salicampi TaxID=1941349 RepID=UPI000B9BDF9F|nr:Gfo/Idh/MocA family oxidoreductase [Sedimentisphaera salicampi]OXU15580.1 1,5-anhydro-D-fructose reductase [Sedimentisphaera salicampi]